MTATIQRYLLQYYAEIKREKNVIDLNCREIQLAITRLENKLLKDDLLRMEKEELEKQAKPRVDLTEVDELIKKAKKVFLYDEQKDKGKIINETKKTKKKNSVYNAERNEQRLNSGQKKPNAQSQDGGKVVTCSEVDLKASTVEEKSTPFFETTFKETYCLNRKLCEKLDKTLQDLSPSQERDDAMAEFISLLNVNTNRNKVMQRRFNDISLNDLTRTNTHDMLLHVSDTRNIAESVLRVYSKDDTPFVISSLGPTCVTKGVADVLTNHFNQRQRQLENDILHQSQNNKNELLPDLTQSERQQAATWRQIYFMLCGGRSLPTLVREPDE
ncbi:uncharacterized protein LOC130649270 [Hydractinia symbiolongicarpus]|uniref:uncharacterized protein LOC130649270 n=1 Tax=Hydractinia symbiolongicarpus TaxID=13093 RepID=UPI00254CB593|nr:uncharacterized protein LOC130649270 [Hydractinia symbiolongicarpus]